MLDKAIDGGREHRKPYRKAKAVDRTCRNHGSCPWCRDDRLHSARRRLLAAEDDLDQLDEGTPTPS